MAVDVNVIDVSVTSHELHVLSAEKGERNSTFLTLFQMSLDFIYFFCALIASIGISRNAFEPRT